MNRHQSMRARHVIVLALTLAAATTFAQQDERAQALDDQIGRIFQSGQYSVPRFGPARWLADGLAYTTLEAAPSPASGVDIVRYDGTTGARTVLVASTRLTPQGSRVPLDIDDYVWSADGKRLLIFTNTQRVWRQNTRGDYWVLDLDSGRLQQLGRDAPASSLMFAKFSPDATRVAYVRGNNLYVERIDTAGGQGDPADRSQAIALTSDGSETTINGTSDWVYEEELDLRDGFRWSLDGHRIAYWQFDSTGVGLFSLINDTDSLYPRITRIPYPKAGTTNSAVRIGVVSASGGPTLWLKTPGDPRDTYLARMDWVDARTVAVQQLNRLQNRNDYLLADVQSGDVKPVFRDESKAWVEVVDDVTWIDSHRAFLWISERDGWQHVYRVSRDGASVALITRDAADVTDVVGVDEAGGWLYFRASPKDATQRYLYRTRLDGSGMAQRLNPDADAGTHGYDLAPGARLAIHTYSRFDRPTTTDVVSLPDHRSLRGLTNTSALEGRLSSILTPAVEFFTVPVDDGVTLDGWMVKPPQFDPARRYPTIVFVYGEPASQTVVDKWGGPQTLFNRALAQAGYVVVSFDNRGTPAPKGAAWRKVIYGSVGDLSSKEQATAVRTLAMQRPYIDSDRIGIWGWSGGGTSTLNAMFRFADVYRVGVAVAPVPDQALYDTIYQERYMGLPKDNQDGYRRGSPIHHAEGLQGKLLIVHGTGDDNVHFQGTERLINRLVALGKPFDVMIYPNRTHGISEGSGTSVHVYRLIARYFLEHLAPGPR